MQFWVSPTSCVTGRLMPIRRRYLQLIRDSGDSLLQIINDILDISKDRKEPHDARGGRT
jgi:signal transduction histidine kinase